MLGPSKISIPSAGGYEKLVIEHIGDDDYTSGPNVATMSPESLIVVDVKFFGVNYADVCIRWGLYESATRYVGWPITPGFEFSGIISKIGPEVSTDLRVGDEVFGLSMFGAYSSRVGVPPAQLFRKPASFSLQEAAAFGVIYITAYYALINLANSKKGDCILVHSAAGGVGSALVQLAKIKGCTVVGVVGSPHKVSVTKANGCDYVIDKSCQNLWREAESICPQGFMAVFDANGVSTLQQSFNHLCPMGRLISYGFHSMLPRQGGKLSILDWIKLGLNYFRTPRFNPIQMTAENKSVMCFNLSFLFNCTEILESCMQDMLTWIDQGLIRPSRVTVYPMNEIASAHRDLESGQSIGKIIIATES